MKARFAALSLVLCFCSLCAAPLGAHHSVAAFDRNNPVVVEGTVKEWHLANPHAWVFVMVPDGKGGQEQWSLEGTAAAGLLRAGYTKYTLRPGEKVRILVAPRRDGAPGGEWTRILAVDGKPMQPNRTAE
jgi:hypothetical protein